MRIALFDRNTLGFLDGSLKKESFSEELGYQWERCNTTTCEVWKGLRERFDKLDVSRTFNLYKDIATLVQSALSVVVYLARLKEQWVELEALLPPPSCSCDKSSEFLAYLQRQKLYQFLIGLNNSYMKARSQIPMMTPLPLVNQAYSMIISDESQKSMTSTSSAGLLGVMPTINMHDSTALYSKNTFSKLKKNQNLIFECCK